MSTSGTYTWTCTRDDVIREALLNIGRIGEVEAPSAQDTVDCSRKLNGIVKQWIVGSDFAPGLKMWTRKKANLYLSNVTGKYLLGPSAVGWAQSYPSVINKWSLAVPVSSGSVLTIAPPFSGGLPGDQIGVLLDSGSIYWTTVVSIVSSAVNITGTIPSTASANAPVWDYAKIATRPLSIETAVLRDINDIDIPLGIMNLEDYERLPTKASNQYPADPQAIYYEAQLTNGVLYTDVGAASDVTKHIHVSYLETIQDFNNPLDNPEFPQEWFRALFWALSKEVSPMYGAQWGKEMEELRLESISMAREGNSRVSSLYFQPNDDRP
jgi:hypothetical protein